MPHPTVRHAKAYQRGRAESDKKQKATDAMSIYE